MYVFNLYHIEHSIIVNHYILPGIMAKFCFNNSDGRIWALFHLALDRDNSGIGLIHFVRKLILFC